MHTQHRFVVFVIAIGDGPEGRGIDLQFSGVDQLGQGICIGRGGGLLDGR